MSEIIVGYDGSDCAKVALEKAGEAAKALGDKVVLVFGYAPGGYGGGEIPSAREAVKELAEKATAEGRGAGGGGGHRARGAAQAAEAGARAARGGRAKATPA